MSPMVGMDPQSGRELARVFSTSSLRLEVTCREVDALMFMLGWLGPDAQELRHDWESRLRWGVLRCAEELAAAGSYLIGQVEEQEQASGVSHETFLVWLAHRAEGAQNLFQDGVAWVSDRVEDGIAWTADRIDDATQVVKVVVGEVATRTDALVKGVARFAYADLILLGQFTRPLTEGRLPQLSELLASVLLVGGTAVGVGVNLTSGRDQHLFDDGRPFTGTPTHLRSGDPGYALPPRNLGDLIRTANASYDSDGVIVTAIRKPGQPTRYLVSIPGTEPPILDANGWNGNPNGRDWPANLYGMATGTSSGTEAAKLAVDRAIAADRSAHGEPASGPPEILLVGHSQGGLIGANLAADQSFSSRYHIAGLVTYGAPVECANVPREIPVLSVQRGADIVPQLDLGGAQLVTSVDPVSPLIQLVMPAANITSVYLPGPLTPGAAHSQAGYADSVSTATGLQSAQLTAWQQTHGISDFYVTDDSQGDSYNVPFGRTVD